jgi:hypothetical protein
MGDYLEYRGTLALNREVFLLNEKRAFSTFNLIDDCFPKMIDAVLGARGPEGKTQVSMVPMLSLMQRQFRSAFQSISSFQAYEAWLLLRPAIEIPLIIGKWFDDRNNVRIWKERATKKKQYRQCFMGEALRSTSLVDSERIQRALSRLNDLFVHPHPEYCYRHLNVQPIVGDQILMRVEYFDEIDYVQITWLAMSHLMVFVQDRLWSAIASRLVGVEGDYAALARFEATFREDADKAAAKSTESKRMLTELGLWVFN